MTDLAALDAQCEKCRKMTEAGALATLYAEVYRATLGNFRPDAAEERAKSAVEFIKKATSGMYARPASVAVCPICDIAGCVHLRGGAQ